jgi:hypothetical protein
VIAGLLERDIFDLFLPEFDKPWVIHLRENLLLFSKPLILEAQHCLQEKKPTVDSKLFSGAVAGERRKATLQRIPPPTSTTRQLWTSSYFLAPLPGRKGKRYSHSGPR